MRFRFLAVVAIVVVASALGVGAALGVRSPDRNVLFAALSGKNEISPETGKKRAGDLNGSGGATVAIDGTELCFGIVVKNIGDPVAAHIHRGRRNQNGPIVVPLTQPSAGDPGASSGCVTVDSDLARDIRRRARRFYVNVHTSAFPNGAVRGQLGR